MTGHGGDGFLKFQDSEEVTNIGMYQKHLSPANKMANRKKYW